MYIYQSEEDRSFAIREMRVIECSLKMVIYSLISIRKLLFTLSPS